jgi:flavin-dependent dehydrogenase
VTDRLKALIGPEVDGAVVNEINRFELFADGRVASIELDKPDLIVERSKVVEILGNQAAEAGAQIEYSTRFLGLREEAECFEVSLGSEHDERKLRTSVVVGADGTNSRVARAAGWPSQPTVPLVQAIIDLPEDIPVDTSRVWFRPEDTPYFYWLVPESGTRAALGVIGENGAETRSRLDRFLGEKGYKAIEYQGARIPVYERWVPVRKSLGRGAVYLVGDAAGQVKVSTVGGLVTGLRGATAVADTILQRRDQRELKRLKRELDLHLIIRRAMHRFSQDDYCFILDQLNNSARKALGSNDRDDASKILWSLFLSRPQLLLKGIRGLITRTPTGT